MNATATEQNPLRSRVRRMDPVDAPQTQESVFGDLFDAMVTASKSQPTECRLVGPTGESVAIPESVFFLLERVVEVMARGDSVTVVPVGKQLTTQQAANMLNISRQYLIRLLDDDKIPFDKTGRHRRIAIQDVLAFKAKRDEERNGRLARLTQLTEDYGGYPD